MLEALIAETGPRRTGRSRQATHALEDPRAHRGPDGRFGEHHSFLARLHLDLIDGHSRAIEELDERIEEAMQPFRATRDLIVTIPGISTVVADVIIAETGGDMSRFPSAGHLASWAGPVRDRTSPRGA